MLTQFNSASYNPQVVVHPQPKGHYKLEWVECADDDQRTSTITPPPTELPFGCLKYLKQNLSNLEFSPSGRYLYMTGGGFVAAGSTNTTYMLQIDLQSGVRKCFGHECSDTSPAK